MEKIVQTVRNSFNTHKTLSLEWRRQNLMSLMRMIDENEQELCQALRKDLNKPEHETIVMELGVIKNSIINTLNNLKKWTKPERKTPIFQVRSLYTTYVYPQPLGVALIIGAWNYPYQVSLVPLVGAISAGCCAIVKPSELSQHSSELLEKLWPKYFDSNFISIVNGGVKETSDLLEQKFDLIFYTGSTMVGKIIMQAAAKHMTPVCLECGGKSPVYVDPSSDLEIAAKRIAWGRFINSGQTCIAPDYILCTKEVQEKLVLYFKKHLTSFYGENASDSKDFCRIINRRHFDRLSNLIDDSKVVLGGQRDENTLFISPTIMVGVKSEDKIMQEEIFGPVLPIVEVADHEEAIKFINARDKPLALYVFSKNEKVFQEFQNRTSSGSFALNECIIQAGFECLPFGGVGASGIGCYHGKYSFDCFSHYRSVLKASFFGESLSFFKYPPYSKSNTRKSQLATCELRESLLTRLLFNPYSLLVVVAAIAYFYNRK